MAAYNASQHALEGLSGALAEEVAPFGIKVTMEAGGEPQPRPENAPPG